MTHRKIFALSCCVLTCLQYGTVFGQTEKEAQSQTLNQAQDKKQNQTTAQATATETNKEVKKAVNLGLNYLRKSQNEDGSWSKNSLEGNGPQPGHSTVTSLSIMAFMSAGKVPGEGADGKKIELGIQFVLSQQQENGIIADRKDRGIEMYCHGISTLMLAEATGMTTGKTAIELRRKLALAVKVILAAQRQSGPGSGGWRYNIAGNDADLSVTGWQLLALRAAKNVGCDVPAERIKLAVEFVRRCYDSEFQGFRYEPNGDITQACTGTGILALELSGKEYHRSDEVLKAGDYLLRKPLIVGRPHFFYGTYYAAQGMFQLGDSHWKNYRPKLHQLLLQSKLQNENGAWSNKGWDDEEYGKIYCTSMAILTLTVEYRFLPIYQRFEEPIEASLDK